MKKKMKHIDIFSSVAEYETAKSAGVLITPNISFINESGGIICLPELDDPYNGHEYVDLELPSGTKWATMNVGASSETDYGNYYQYGKGAAQYTADIADIRYRGIEDPLDSSVDTATQMWGGQWHMPTKAQMEELIANTTYEWVENYKGSGINGGTFTATNGAVLFFPAASNYYEGHLLESYVNSDGSYWSSSPYPNSNDDFGFYAYFLSLYDGAKNEFMVNSAPVNEGYSVRPVVG